MFINAFVFYTLGCWIQQIKALCKFSKPWNPHICGLLWQFGFSPENWKMQPNSHQRGNFVCKKNGEIMETMITCCPKENRTRWYSLGTQAGYLHYRWKGGVVWKLMVAEVKCWGWLADCLQRLFLCEFNSYKEKQAFFRVAEPIPITRIGCKIWTNLQFFLKITFTNFCIFVVFLSEKAWKAGKQDIKQGIV